jgi:hypothetical protein
MDCCRVRLLGLCGVLAFLYGSVCCADFYRWTDTRGQLRISNIPPQGVAGDGSVAPRFNPSSIVGQQAALRARLKARDQALQAARDAAHSRQDAAAAAGFDPAEIK